MIVEMISRLKDVNYAYDPNIKHKLIIDRENQSYQVMMLGWDSDDNRVHHSIVHIDIIGGKIWVQKNSTEIDFGKELVYKGVPPSDIVVGFLSPELREMSDYAVA